MFVLKAGDKYTINTDGCLEENPSKPMRFNSWELAKLYANQAGIRTPLTPVEVPGE